MRYRSQTVLDIESLFATTAHRPKPLELQRNNPAPSCTHHALGALKPCPWAVRLGEPHDDGVAGGQQYRVVEQRLEVGVIHEATDIQAARMGWNEIKYQRALRVPDWYKGVVRGCH